MNKGTLFIFYKSVVFPAQAEYPYFSADFRMYWGFNFKCLESIASAGFFSFCWLVLLFRERNNLKR